MVDTIGPNHLKSQSVGVSFHLCEAFPFLVRQGSEHPSDADGLGTQLAFQSLSPRGCRSAENKRDSMTG
ncbi:hypothetical protein ABBQ32_005006 [Trebouxia sp. C0010 RCD-2024]